MSHGAAPGRATPCQALPAACSKRHPLPPASLSPRCVPTVLMLHFPASTTPLSRKEPRAPHTLPPHPLTSWVLFHPRGHIPLPAGRGPRRGSPTASLLTSGIRDTRNLWGSITSACPRPAEEAHTGGCPCLPADGEDGHLAGMSSEFGGFGGTERWQHLRPLLAAAGARGRSLHRVQVLLVVAGRGKLRQEVQPGEGGNAISMDVVPPWGVLSAALGEPYLLRGAELGGICCCL